MGLFDHFPYTNFHELNLDWMLNALRELEHTINDFVAINALKYADPIQWNITSQYEKNTIVIDPQTGTAYISVQPVPAGVSLTNTDYWTIVFDLSMFIDKAAKNLTDHVEGQTNTATFNSSVGDWLIWYDVLYKVIAPINAGDTYVVNSNIEKITVEDIIKAINTEVGNIQGDILSLQNADIAIIERIDNLRIINVLDHGAKGDGVTDDTAALQTIFSNINSHDCVYFPAGTYIIKDTLTIGDIDDIKIMGAGTANTKILYDGTDTTKNLIVIGTGAGIKRVNVKGFAFYSNIRMSSGAALKIVKAIEGSYIEDILINDLNSYNLYDGIELEKFNVVFANNIKMSYGHDNILLHGDSNDFYLNNCFMNYSQKSAIHCAGGVGGIYIENTLLWSPAIGLRIDQDKSTSGNREFFLSETFVIDAIVDNGIYIDAPNSTAMNIESYAFISGAGYWSSTPYKNNVYIKDCPIGVLEFIGGVFNHATAYGLYNLDSTCKIIINGTRITNNAGGGVYSNTDNVRMSNIYYETDNGTALCNGSVKPYYNTEIDVVNDKSIAVSKLAYFVRDNVAYWNVRLTLTSAEEWIQVTLPFTPNTSTYKYYCGTLGNSSTVHGNTVSNVLVLHTNGTDTGDLIITGSSDIAQY